MRPEFEFPSAREAAAAWHDRLHREKVSEETRGAFTRWLNESPDHQGLYDAVDQTWSTFLSAGDDPRILALRHETALRLTFRTSRTLRPWRWAAAAVIVLSLGALLVSGAPHPWAHGSPIARLLESLGSSRTDRYATATGERLAFTLSDGSQVTLDTDSELKVAFTKAERAVYLTRGQAFFEVAKDYKHPFVVEAQSRRFVAVGTAFDVRLDGQQVRVTMVEGTVRVERPGSAAVAPAAKDPSASTRTRRAESSTKRGQGSAEGLHPVVTTITAGEQLVSDAGHQDHVQTTDPDRSTSWRRGQIIFDNTRLADAVAELNRYSELKVELADPALAELRLSGAFATGRPNLFIEAITSYFPIEVVRADDLAVILSAKK